jgi:AcrR family transcriptional regulator
MTRNEILDASAQIFSQKGYHGTSMQDIAVSL